MDWQEKPRAELLKDSMARIENKAGLSMPAVAEGAVSTPSISDFVGRWYVLHTRARNEKAVAVDLGRLGIQHFLPLIRYRRTYGGRKRRVEIPLFPGYVFLCGNRADREAALRTHRIAHVLDVPDQARIRDDLEQVHRVVVSEETVDFYPKLRKGARCRVVAGTLKGLEGVVLRRPGHWRVFVGVEFLGQSAELEIDPSFLIVLD